MHSIAKHFDGSFLTGGELFDSHSRMLASIDGERDPNAVFPVADGTAVPEDGDYDDEPVPPTAERVVRRMYALLALAARGLLDMNLKMGNKPAYRLDKLHQWLEALDIAEEFEPDEWKIVQTTEGSLSQQDTVNCVWAIEGLAVLAWSLQLADLSRYDQLAETDSLLQALSFLDVAMSRYKLAHPDLRQADELESYNNQVFALNWRMVDFRVRPEQTDFANVDFGYGKFDLSWATLEDGDLSLQGQPISIADGELVQAVGSAAMDRQKASNWIRGDARLYSHISTDT